ncbi:MAG: hypothetical protein HKO59_05080 [Phycisphaerales bacterium]|nr:hypothetical protein [Phycisphaerales bacterium]NNM25346.1 hypothetical protein [Phycisphaerales bacterium]
MAGAVFSDAGIARYELEIEIDAPPDAVWSALVDETNAWWLPDFHMMGSGSVVTFEPHAGGGLIEKHADGGSLLWYTVQWIRPADRTVYLLGNIAPDWGGPTCSHFKLLVEARGDGSVLRATDAHLGNIDEKNLGSLASGWTTLFTDGLRAFVQEGVRHD